MENWIDISQQLPPLNEEYIIAIDLEDGENSLVVFAAEYSIKQNSWCWSNTKEKCQGTVLFWREKPAPPEVKWKKVLKTVPLTLDESERVIYGQCVHGENMVTCPICNKEENVFYEINKD